MGISAAVTAFFNMLKQFLSTKDTELKQKPTLEVVKDKKSLKKATNVTEEILLITDKYKQFFDTKDLKKYERLVKRFYKNN